MISFKITSQCCHASRPLISESIPVTVCLRMADPMQTVIQLCVVKKALEIQVLTALFPAWG